MNNGGVVNSLVVGPIHRLMLETKVLYLWFYESLYFLMLVGWHLNVDICSCDKDPLSPS